MSEDGSCDPAAVTNESIKKEFFRKILEAYSGSNSGASRGEVKSSAASDDGGSTSSQQSPEEYPSPAPSNTPPDSMASLQAESPTGDEDTANDGEQSTEGTSVAATSERASPEVSIWHAEHGYHFVPYEGELPRAPHAFLFVHVPEGEVLQFQRPTDGVTFGSLEGPGTVRMVGTQAMLSQPLPLTLRDNLQCHQFLDEEGILRHVVLSHATSDNSGQSSQELNVPQLVGGKNLSNAMGGVPQQQNGQGPSKNSGRGGHHSNGNGRGNYGNVNGNGNQRYGNNGGFNHNDYGHRNNGYKNGNGRGGKHGGKNRGDYQGKPRSEYVNHNNHYNNNAPPPLPELNANHDQGRQGNHPENNVDQNVVMPNGQNRKPKGQMSLLGEPAGVPLNEMHMKMPPVYLPPPPLYQQQGMPVNMTEAQDIPMGMVPMVMNGEMNGNKMQQVIMQDQMIPGTSMGMLPQAYGIPPPGMMIVPSETQFNNNKWMPFSNTNNDEGIRQCLTKLEAPKDANCLTTEAEFKLNPLNVTHFEVPGNSRQYYPIDLNEITYHASIYDTSDKLLSTAQVELKKFRDDLMFRVQSLHPNVSYKISVQAAIVSRGLYGEPTKKHTFRTAPGRPDPPKAFIVDRGQHFFTMKWDAATNNGVFVNLYHVYVHEDELGNGRMLQTADEKIEIPRLNPKTTYTVRVNARNALGESLTGAKFKVKTKPDSAPGTPQKMIGAAETHSKLRILWDGNPSCTYTVEMYNIKTGRGDYACEEIHSDTASIPNLEPDSDFQVRVLAKNDEGACYSQYMNFSTPQESSSDEGPHRQPAPPSFNRYVDHAPEMVWRSYGQPQHDYCYIVEGSTLKDPDNFVEMYRGNFVSLAVLEETMHFIRVTNVYQKGVRSPPSERALIPRDYSRFRPERVQNVKVTLQNGGNILVEWTKVNPENLPPSAKLIYFAQRCDSNDNPVLGVGNENHGVFENVPGETKVAIQVRAVVCYNNTMIYGDWCNPIHITTPRGPPPPVINVKFDSKTSTLYWECLDQSNDLQFVAKVLHLPSKNNILKVTTKSRNAVIDAVQPGEKYGAALISQTSVGRTPKQTAVEFVVPPLKPTAPSNVTLSQVRIDGCVISWKASEANGARIVGYVVRLMENRELFREHFVAGIDTETNYKLALTDLKSNTDYSITVAAKNSVGFSEKIAVLVKTQPDPPSLPEIYCDCEPTYLKFHWDHVTSSPSILYKLVRVNEHGQKMSVYEGENNQVKVKNLQENTRYSFKLRVLDKISGADSWTSVFHFSTTVAPPPTVKKSPTNSLVRGKTHSYRIEWQNTLPQDSRHDQFYRLQYVDALIPGAKWETAYEGKATSYVMDTEPFKGALHVRVLCVRKEKTGELKGSPSPVGYIANIPPPVEEVEIDEEPTGNRFLDTHNVLFISFCLLVCAILGVTFFDELINFMYGLVAPASPRHSPSSYRSP
uniref:Fibronectin type-III domain-containing protein n=1 Tax=Caenorhabditis tropicalis TaxID=1561998 RepID=A0A1I7T5U1_9PELO